MSISLYVTCCVIMPWPGHQSKECSTKNKICWFCKKQGHHQAICLKQFGKKEESKQINNNIEEEIQLQSVRTNKEESNQTKA
uniref:Candidate secreted effector n=1 Tax=Meloidogyne incognita TaxID=6306 RepID=A0A914M782_MELIC